MDERRRSTDRGWRRFLRENWYRDVWLLVMSGLLILSLSAQRTESQQRRSQNCVVFERLYRTDVHQLTATYDYIAKLKPEDLRSALNQAVLAGLPRTERQAEASRPPVYCLEPGVGLPGTVRVPERPARVDQIMEALTK